MFGTIRNLFTLETSSSGPFNFSCTNQSKPITKSNSIDEKVSDHRSMYYGETEKSGFSSPMGTSYRQFTEVDVAEAVSMPEAERLLRKQCNKVLMASCASNTDIEDQCAIAKRNIKVNCVYKGHNFRELNGHGAFMHSSSRSNLYRNQANEDTKNAMIRARKSTLRNSSSEMIEPVRSSDGQEIVTPFLMSVKSAGDMDKDKYFVSSSSFVCLSRTVLVVLDGSKDCDRAIKVASTLVLDGKKDNLVVMVPWNSRVPGQVMSTTWTTPTVSGKKSRLLLKQKLWEASCNIARRYEKFIKEFFPEIDYTLLVPDSEGHIGRSITTVSSKYLADWVIIPRVTEKHRDKAQVLCSQKLQKYVQEHSGRSQVVIA